MGSIVDFLIVHKGIFIFMGAAILFILLLSFFKGIFAKKQRNKEINQAAADRVRDENLNSVILNHYGNDKNQKEVYVPYDVDYGNGESGKNVTGKNNFDISVKQVMIQLIEKTELSTRKFVLNPAKKIRIGSDLQNNDISILSEGIAPQQCEIFSVKDKVYIRNLSTGMQTIIRRRKEKALVDEKGIRLLSNDTIILGKVMYEIMIIN